MSPIYLIRHGRTRANEEHLYCGSSDLPLSPGGEAELRQLHYFLPPVRFLTSGMTRTEQTLSLLFGEVPHEIRPAFREIDFGIFELHTYEELKDDPQYQRWLTGNNEENVPPQGESGVQMTRRVTQAIPKLLENDTVLVTHGGVIAAIMDYLFPEAGKSRYAWQPEPGHGYKITGDSYQAIP